MTAEVHVFGVLAASKRGQSGAVHDTFVQSNELAKRGLVASFRAIEQAAHLRGFAVPTISV